MRHRVLNPESILIFYDIPILFLASDQFGCKYIALHVDSIDNKARYLTRPITNSSFLDLVHKRVALTTVFRDSQVSEWYYWDTKSEEDFELPREVDFRDIPHNYFPADSLFLDLDLGTNEQLIEDAYTRQRPVVCLGIDDHNTESIEASILAEILGTFQAMVKYAYKKAMTTMNKARRDYLDTPANFILSAYTSRPGSFQLFLDANSTKDLFSGFDIGYSLERIVSMIEDDEDKLIQSLRDNQGYAVSNYSKMLQTVVKNDVSLAISWADPSLNKVRSKMITPAYASRVIDLINSKSELSKVFVSLIGQLESIDVITGNWRIIDRQGTRYSGTGTGDLLRDRRTSSIEYTLTCEETIEEESIAGKEKKKYHLVSIDETTLLSLT